MVGYSSENRSPRLVWLDTLLAEKFFDLCSLHESERKNEKNIFCLDCCASICAHCASHHPSHRFLQIRRYVYHDVTRVDDLEKLIDCAFVQSYTTNSAKVVFLTQRPYSRPAKGSGNVCGTCSRSLQEPFLFCCVACKVQYFMRTEGSLVKCIRNHLPVEEGLSNGVGGDDLDDELKTPVSVIQSPESFETSSVAFGFSDLEPVKKKRTIISVAAEPLTFCSPATDVLVINNRRKGIPHRSPLY